MKLTAWNKFPDDLLVNSRRIESEAYVLDGKDARNACAAIVLSSGTTGLQKAVMLSHHNLVAICEQLRAHNPDNWRGDHAGGILSSKPWSFLKEHGHLN